MLRSFVKLGYQTTMRLLLA